MGGTMRNLNRLTSSKLRHRNSWIKMDSMSRMECYSTLSFLSRQTLCLTSKINNHKLFNFATFHNSINATRAAAVAATQTFSAQQNTFYSYSFLNSHHQKISAIHRISHRQCSQNSILTNSLSTFMSKMSIIFAIFFLIILLPSGIGADRNRRYHISSLCLREGQHPLYKKIDGAVITSKSENGLDCTITFQTDTILQKFMLHFEKLALDCNDHLFIYDGAHTIGNHKAHLSCRSTRAEVGTIYTQGSFLTLHYTTDAYSKSDNGFVLVLTAYKDSKNHCREHRCANQFCISRDLVCDAVNHCGDNSDESYYASCQEYQDPDTIIGLEPMVFIVLVSCVFISCLACVISVSFCLCRRERLIRSHQQRMALAQQQQLQQYQLNDTGQHLGTTPLMAHHNSFNTKLDSCTMITSLDYGTTPRNGLVNSYTHTALPSNFATLPHLHHASHTISPLATNNHSAMPASQSHVRFGTLPIRGNGVEKLPGMGVMVAVGGGGTSGIVAPPPYPGQFGINGGINGMIAMNGSVPINGNGNGLPSNSGNGTVTFANSNGQAISSPQSNSQVIYSVK